LAGSKNLESVAQRLEAKLASDPTLHFFQLRREEFNRIAARCAHHMMMSAAVQALLVTHHSIAKIDLESQSTLAQELERSIDRRVTDAGIFLLNEEMEFLSA
jgi:hypothetical protein